MGRRRLINIEPTLNQYWFNTFTILSSNAGTTLGQRHRRGTDIKPALGECFVFAYNTRTPENKISNFSVVSVLATACHAGPALIQHRANTSRNKRPRPNVGLMLAHGPRRWLDIG